MRRAFGSCGSTTTCISELLCRQEVATTADGAMRGALPGTIAAPVAAVWPMGGLLEVAGGGGRSTAAGADRSEGGGRSGGVVAVRLLAAGRSALPLAEVCKDDDRSVEVSAKVDRSAAGDGRPVLLALL